MALVHPRLPGSNRIDILAFPIRICSPTPYNCIHRGAHMYVHVYIYIHIHVYIYMHYIYMQVRLVFIFNYLTREGF